MFRKAILAAALLLASIPLGYAPAAAANLNIKDGNSTAQVLCAISMSDGSLSECNILVDSTGAKINPATKENQALSITAEQATAANTAPAGLGAMAAIPAASTNGTALGTLPAAAKGARFYLSASDSVTFTVATSAPTAAPANTYTISGASTGTGPNWDESLASGAMIYITASTGSPKFRWF